MRRRDYCQQKSVTDIISYRESQKLEASVMRRSSFRPAIPAHGFFFLRAPLERRRDWQADFHEQIDPDRARTVWDSFDCSTIGSKTEQVSRACTDHQSRSLALNSLNAERCSLVDAKNFYLTDLPCGMLFLRYVPVQQDFALICIVFFSPQWTKFALPDDCIGLHCPKVLKQSPNTEFLVQIVESSKLEHFRARHFDGWQLIVCIHTSSILCVLFAFRTASFWYGRQVKKIIVRVSTYWKEKLSMRWSSLLQTQEASPLKLKTKKANVKCVRIYHSNISQATVARHWRLMWKYPKTRLWFTNNLSTFTCQQQPHFLTNPQEGSKY